MAAPLISLGSNVGNRVESLRQALALLALTPGVRIAATSTFHETKPAGGPASQEKFLNAAALLETDLPPLEILLVLQEVEQKLGRIRAERWGPRTIDLDLLLYEKLELETPELTIPHPRMSFRRFVLEPAAEIAADMVHPVCGNTIGGLLEHLNHCPRWIFISGIVDVREVFANICQVHSVIGDRFPRYRATAAKVKQLRTQWVTGDNERLEMAIHKLQDHQWVVSDWWWEGGLSWLNSHELTKLRRSPIAVPRLLVVGPYGFHRHEVQRLRHLGIFCGPMLWLKDCTPDELRDEVMAAITAME
ncbi:MAG TPA: 2-amino-4-hydroxy-6-hydroxymethyldihydropteridine diphosphokinase [Pirellulaceae bacterium]|nr:2-amino-4-hydroxy-6-hydroxymethyldihydropteridine diphosphokinase [Pirellulaceae bacterium]